MNDPLYYDNDEIMAKLGRDMLDMIIGQRNKGFSDTSIGLSILQLADEHISEVAPEDEDT